MKKHGSYVSKLRDEPGSKTRNHSKRSNLSERIGHFNPLKSKGYPYTNARKLKRKSKLSFPESKNLVFGEKGMGKHSKNKNFKSQTKIKALNREGYDKSIEPDRNLVSSFSLKDTTKIRNWKLG
jgi:hypothetical protein